MEQQSPPTEESIFNEADYSMAGYDKHVRNARIVLYVVAVLILFAIALITPIDDPAKYISLGLIILLSAAFAGLGLWSKKKPFTAILIALILFVVMQVLNVVFEPSSIFSGWYIKIAVILFLIMGLRNAKEIEDRRKAFGK